MTFNNDQQTKNNSSEKKYSVNRPIEIKERKDKEQHSSGSNQAGSQAFTKDDDRKTVEEASENKLWKQGERSLLFQPLSLGLFLLLLVFSIWYRATIFISLFSFLLVLGIILYIWRVYSIRKIQTTIQLQKNRLFAGTKTAVTVQVKNNKWLPLVWLEWEFPASEIVEWKDSREERLIVRFLWLFSFKKGTWQGLIHGKKRGVYPIGQGILRTGDGFRFSDVEEPVHLQQYVYIYPKLLPIHVPLFYPTLQWELEGSEGGFLEDPLLIRGVREYEPGDERRSFNWRASARTGKILTNVFQPIVSKQIVVAIDVTGFIIEAERYEDEEEQAQYERIKRTEFERLLSIVASFIMAYDRQGVQIGFLSNGKSYFGDGQPYLPPQRSVTNVLDGIAQMTQKKAQKPSHLLEELSSHVVATIPLFVFTYELTKAYKQFLEKSGTNYNITYYYMIENNSLHHQISEAVLLDELTTSG